MKKQNESKPMIESLINTAALAVTSAGTIFLLAGDGFGFLLIGFGLGIEFFKYWGRKNGYW